MDDLIPVWLIGSLYIFLALAIVVNWRRTGTRIFITLSPPCLFIGAFYILTIVLPFLYESDIRALFLRAGLTLLAVSVLVSIQANDRSLR